MTKKRFPLRNLGVGVGLRTVHFRHLLEHAPALDWLEIISENFLDTAGRPLEVLDRLAARYPIVMHGVSLSIGSTERLDRAYLRRLRALRDRVKAHWVSDHLCFTSAGGINTHDLLPLPYTRAALRHVIGRVRAVQDFLGAPLLLENPSTYVEHTGSTIPEAEFLAEVAEAADCGILLDVNNVYVTCKNHGLDPLAYLDTIPHQRVGQIHVAGHTDLGTHLLDSHVGPVPDPVWALYDAAIRRGGAVATLLEWDEAIPDFETVHAAALRAKDFLGARSVA
ncbi:MAG: DUF692 domain-containing protein [Myxococcota bacterium]